MKKTVDVMRGKPLSFEEREKLAGVFKTKTVTGSERLM